MPPPRSARTQHAARRHPRRRRAERPRPGSARRPPLLPDSDCVGALALYAASYLSPGTVTRHDRRPTPTSAPATARRRRPPSPPRACSTPPCPPSPSTTSPAASGRSSSSTRSTRCRRSPGLSAQETPRRPPAAAHRHGEHARGRAGRLDAGVRFGSLQGLSDGILRFVARAPLWAGQLVPLLMKRADGRDAEPRIDAAEHPARPADRDRLPQRRRRRRGARRSGARRPVNAALVDLVHEVERTGAFLTAGSHVVERAQAPLGSVGEPLGCAVSAAVGEDPARTLRVARRRQSASPTAAGRRRAT